MCGPSTIVVEVTAYFLPPLFAHLPHCFFLLSPFYLIIQQGGESCGGLPGNLSGTVPQDLVRRLSLQAEGFRQGQQGFLFPSSRLTLALARLLTRSLRWSVACLLACLGACSFCCLPALLARLAACLLRVLTCLPGSAHLLHSYPLCSVLPPSRAGLCLACLIGRSFPVLVVLVFTRFLGCLLLFA